MPSAMPDYRASITDVGWHQIMLLDDICTSVNDLPESTAAGCQSCDLLIASRAL